MKKYTVPVIYNLRGWFTMEASSQEEAEKKAQQINNGELDLNITSIKVSDQAVECMVDEIEEQM